MKEGHLMFWMHGRVSLSYTVHFQHLAQGSGHLW